MVLLNTFKLKHLPNKLTRYSSMNVVTPRYCCTGIILKVTTCSWQRWHKFHIFIANCPAYSKIDISQAPTSTSVCMFQDGGLWILNSRELKATTTTTATKTPQICIFDNENQYFCTLCTCIFHLLTFWRRSRSFYDVKWPVLQLCGRREHMMTNVQFCLLISQALVPI